MQLDLSLAGLTCLECARKVERALRAMPGVRQASVNYPTGRATIVADDAAADPAALRQSIAATIEATGYHLAEDVPGDGAGTAAAPAPATLAHRSAAPPPTPTAPRPTAASTHGEPGRSEAARGTAPGAIAARDAGSVDYELLVIGSGSAGMAAAIRAAELGMRSAIVEAAEVVGGTCVNVGCIPSKFLIEAGHHYHTARSTFPGISACSPELAWRELGRAKQAVVEKLREEKYIAVLKAYDSITLLRGRAALESAPEPSAEGASAGAAGDGVVRVRVDQQLVLARKVVLATGTAPAMPSVPGLAEVGALDSTSVMALEALPASLVVVGGGSIGLELGQVFARFGVRVILLELESRILPTEDPDVSAALTAALEAEGLEIQTGVRVTGAARTADGVVLAVERGSLRGEVHAERVLVATGRRPNTRGLGLEAVGVAIDRHGFIPTDEFMRTSHPAVYAAGDVTGGPGFVYVAALQGGVAAQAALADQTGEASIPIDLGATPRVTFTDPQVAAVGLTEAEARAAGYEPKVTTLPVAALPRAAVSYRRQGMIKLVADRASDRLLGAHLVSANAGDVIGEAALALKFTLTAQNLVSTLHPYLTWGEGLKLAAQTFTKDVALLSCCA